MAGRLSLSNIELFFSTSASSDLYGRSILLESYARMLSSMHRLLLILTWYDFLRPYCSSLASRCGLTGTARVNVGLPAPCISGYALLLFDPMAMHGCFYFDRAEIILCPLRKFFGRKHLLRRARLPGDNRTSRAQSLCTPGGRCATRILILHGLISGAGWLLRCLYPSRSTTAA